MAKKNKVKFIDSFKVPIYNITVSVFVGQDKPNYDAYVYKDKGVIKAVFMKKCSDHIIVHEAVHIVNFIFKEVGVELSISNDETQAYLTQYIFQTIKTLL